ncbi:hypothetical protein AA23498_1366 [Acetobacter nitrogenifigens DSM 23921 = NBRC 105050]|uniref:Uncharacterized protein n=1 Tax=Acetobacter nitrogenifigens DSM 23921 = NBRC 105050 TaxID=1120919 RepID=A0A511X5B5_9PROT|nr:hypothetical protein [Acetobacter nitrogenifigens]GBQ92099.1 hypothetical protein AA23498_1366 [Acetobacter nitrogenifigens DSM 23921 = NBRC 105050]GEN58126.1 hypothetical protein ANI02nite_00100 [Acetobacter nitrogenifigens DSM 23921 = NBRC 105050]
MTLYRAELREMAVDALKAANTIAGPNVFSARSLPVTDEALPALYLQVPDDDGVSDGRSAPSFTRTATLAIRGYVAAGTPEKSELVLEHLAEQIELALMTSVPLMAAVQQVSFLRTQMLVSSDTGQHKGELRMLLGLEYTETYPLPGTPLTGITGQIEATGHDDFAGFSAQTI